MKFVEMKISVLLKKMGISFIDADYDVQNWFARSKGMEYEPERAKRCSMCFGYAF